ncbi:MAG: hypothetical protein IPG61_09385 [bacterium]|nr:hypothetical protein [bacterium]
MNRRHAAGCSTFSSNPSTILVAGSGVRYHRRSFACPSTGGESRVS